MSSIDVQPTARLYDLLDVYRVDDGVNEVRRIASLHVGGFDGAGFSVLGSTIAKWSTQDLAGELAKAFTLDPFAMMAKAWSQVHTVREALRKSVGPPPSEQKAPLFKHEIDAKARPRLVLNVAGVDCCDLAFEVKLALAFESVQLELYDAALRAVRLGKATGSISLSCNGAPIPAFKRELNFKSKYTFDPPILGPRAPASVASAERPLPPLPTLAGAA